jgi:type IX secretion system substrate protein
MILVISTLVPTQAQQKYVKAHAALYTQTMLDFYLQSMQVKGDTAKAMSGIVADMIDDDMKLKRALMTTDQDFSSLSQWIYLGLAKLNVTEEDKDLARDQIYTACTQAGQPLYEDIEQLKSTYNISNINPYIMTKGINFAARGENIRIRHYAVNFGQTYCGGFLTMVMPKTGTHTLTPIEGWEYTDPTGKVHMYGTLGGLNASFMLFAHKGDKQLIYVNNNQEIDTAYVPVGDDDHDFNNPTTGAQLENVFNKAEDVNLNFQTRPDTLRKQFGDWDMVKLSPTHNDDNVGSIGIVVGTKVKSLEDGTYIEFDQWDTDRKTQIGAYTVSINGYGDGAFAADFFIIEFVPKLEHPSIDQSTVPSSVKAGDTFTIRLKGDIDLMTSWIPEWNISGVEYEIIATDNKSVTIKALTGGQMTVTLHHKAFWVHDDESVTISVQSDIQKPLAPEALTVFSTTEGQQLSWEDSQDDVTFIVFWKTGSTDYTTIATGLTVQGFTDERELQNGTHFYMVRAQNEAGESENSNEVSVIITSVNEYIEPGTGIHVYPNPCTDYFQISFRMKNQNDVVFRLFDTEGKYISEQTQSGKEISLQMQLKNQASGVYLLEVEIKGQKEIIKIIKN